VSDSSASTEAPDIPPSFRDAPPPRPTITWTGVGLAAVCWILYGLFYTFFIARQEPNAPFLGLLLGQLFYSLVLGLWSLPVWWVTVRTMDRVHWGWTLTAHLVLGPAYAWTGLESYLLLFRTWIGPTAVAEMEANYQWILFGNLTIYAVQFAVYHLVRSVQRLRWHEQQAAEYAAVARERELAALKAQINPHFLFNTLNLISATVHTAPEEARNMISALSELLRYALQSTHADSVSLREEVDFVKSYLDLESQRFSDRLEVNYDLAASAEAMDVSVPPMILQPLAENAIKHGISPSAEGGTIALSIDRTNEHLRVCVEDTGVGPDGPVLPENGAAPDDDAASSGSGVGLSNTSRRLQHAFGPRAALRTDSIDPHGFRVWFHIPL